MPVNLIQMLTFQSADTDCDLFLKILTQELSEDVYHDEKAEMEDALYLAQETDRAEHDGKTTGKCSKEGFLLMLRQRFNKTFEQVTYMHAKIWCTSTGH